MKTVLIGIAIKLEELNQHALGFIAFLKTSLPVICSQTFNLSLVALCRVS